MNEAITAAKAGYIYTQRNAGVSFKDIGKKLGMTRQGAHNILETYFKKISEESND